MDNVAIYFPVATGALTFALRLQRLRLDAQSFSFRISPRFHPPKMDPKNPEKQIAVFGSP
jgi:hypothetical protein